MTDRTPDHTPPIATQRTRLRKGGFNMRSHDLVERSASRLVFRRSRTTKLVLVFMVLMGAGMIAFLFWVAQDVGHRRPLYALPFVMAVPALAAWMIQRATPPLLFDRTRGRVSRGPGADEATAPVRPDGVALAQIRGLQILEKRVRSSSAPYTSFELNAVLDDGSRWNVFDHADRRAMERQAETIASFLDVPSWREDESAG